MGRPVCPSELDESQVRIDDPVREIWMSLRNHGDFPPMAWIVKWSEGGKDPVDAAWNNGRHDLAMREILEAISPSKVLCKNGYSFSKETICNDGNCHVYPCEACCKAIRRIVPTITLVQVQEALDQANRCANVNG